MKSPILLCALLFCISCKQNEPTTEHTSIVGQGQMPNIVKDNDNNLHLVYGSGDSVLYRSSNDGGKTFSAPSLVATVPGVYDFAMRGPQVACTNEGVTIIACNKEGDIYAYNKSASGNWTAAARVNDEDTVAKEGLMALGGDGNTLFAAWLDLRGNKRNKIVGAKSTDGGKTWAKNILVYASPDSSVCECCKPSVAVKGDKVFVMFRNWLHGNRDLYVITSPDGGNSFGAAEKLGNGNWPLNGCPMDGGGIAINANNVAQTVWRRQDSIFSCTAGQAEVAIGKGKGCTIATINSKTVYAWAEKDTVVCLLPNGTKQILGKGILPIIKPLNDEQVICVWENDKQIESVVIGL